MNNSIIEPSKTDQSSDPESSDSNSVTESNLSFNNVEDIGMNSSGISYPYQNQKEDHEPFEQ